MPRSILVYGLGTAGEVTRQSVSNRDGPVGTNKGDVDFPSHTAIALEVTVTRQGIFPLTFGPIGACKCQRGIRSDLGYECPGAGTRLNVTERLRLPSTRTYPPSIMAIWAMRVSTVV
jgi:hypothetical protein